MVLRPSSYGRATSVRPQALNEWKIRLRRSHWESWNSIWTCGMNESFAAFLSLNFELRTFVFGAESEDLLNSFHSELTLFNDLFIDSFWVVRRTHKHHLHINALLSTPTEPLDSYSKATRSWKTENPRSGWSPPTESRACPVQPVQIRKGEATARLPLRWKSFRLSRVYLSIKIESLRVGKADEERSGKADEVERKADSG